MARRCFPSWPAGITPWWGSTPPPRVPLPPSDAAARSVVAVPHANVAWPPSPVRRRTHTAESRQAKVSLDCRPRGGPLRSAIPRQHEIPVRPGPWLLKQAITPGRDRQEPPAARRPWRRPEVCGEEREADRRPGSLAQLVMATPYQAHRSAATAVPQATERDEGSAEHQRRTRRSGRFGRGNVLRSRPLVTGDSGAASHRARPLPVWSAGRSRDPGERGRGSTGDLGPCRPGPNAGGIAPRRRYREGCSGERAPGGKLTENRNRATAGGSEPENAGRRATGGRRAKGTNPVGKREAGGKPAGDPAGREVRPQTTR
jgi:hypothetical protein